MSDIITELMCKDMERGRERADKFELALSRAQSHNQLLQEAIRGITSRLLPGRDAMDMHFTRGDIERLEALLK